MEMQHKDGHWFVRETALSPLSKETGQNVGWVGTSGVAVCLFVDDDTGGLDWARWEAAGGWVVQSDEPVAGLGASDSVRLLQGAANARVLAFVSDAAGKLFAASYDGASWTVETPALETSLSSTVSVPFDAVAR